MLNVLKMFTIFVCRINFFCTFKTLLDTFDASDGDLKVGCVPERCLEKDLGRKPTSIGAILNLINNLS